MPFRRFELRVRIAKGSLDCVLWVWGATLVSVEGTMMALVLPAKIDPALEAGKAPPSVGSLVVRVAILPGSMCLSEEKKMENATKIV